MEIANKRLEPYSAKKRDAGRASRHARALLQDLARAGGA